MSTGVRQTFYFKSLSGMKKLATEENIEVNGNTFEELFWEKYAGADANYNFQIRCLYNGEKTLQDVLQSFTEIQAYNEQYIKKGNVKFVKIVRTAIGSSEWIPRGEYRGDYHVDNRIHHVDNLAEIFNVIARELEARVKVLEQPIFKHSDIKPWTLEVQDNRYEEILTNEANYSPAIIEQFKHKANYFLSAIEENTYPGQILDLIIANWDYFWNFTSTYEAVEYCIALSAKVTDKPLIRKSLREFSIQTNSE